MLVVAAAKKKMEAKAATYREQLARLGVSWTGDLPLLREAIYPIDATQENLAALAVNPPCLDEFVSPQSPASESCRPVILMLARNSD
jgi:hypothetical protein